MERKMKKSEVLSIESYSFETVKDNVPDFLSQKLYQFLSKSYHVINQQEFENLIIKPESEGELSVFFGPHDEIAGFCRTIKQSIVIRQEELTVFITYIFLNPYFNIQPSIDTLALNQAIQYKLSNPGKKLIDLVFANHPTIYAFICKMHSTIYPKPNQKIPHHVFSVINQLKKENQWETIKKNHHPMIVNSPIIPVRGQYQMHNEGEYSEWIEYYLNTNPDYLQGNSLLVYLPIELASLNFPFKLKSPTRLHYNNGERPFHLHQPHKNA